MRHAVSLWVPKMLCTLAFGAVAVTAHSATKKFMVSPGSKHDAVFAQHDTSPRVEAWAKKGTIYKARIWKKYKTDPVRWGNSRVPSRMVIYRGMTTVQAAKCWTAVWLYGWIRLPGEGEEEPYEIAAREAAVLIEDFDIQVTYYRTDVRWKAKGTGGPPGDDVTIEVFVYSEKVDITYKRPVKRNGKWKKANWTTFRDHLSQGVEATLKVKYKWGPAVADHELSRKIE